MPSRVFELPDLAIAAARVEGERGSIGRLHIDVTDHPCEPICDLLKLLIDPRPDAAPARAGIHDDTIEIKESLKS